MSATDLAKQLQEYTSKYGVAWVIVNQFLGWVSFFAIWIFLEQTTFDVMAWIAKYKLMRALTSHLSKSAGNIAIAFALNRIGTPPRIFLTTWLMPYTAPRINALVNPYLRKIGVVFGHGTGVPEPQEMHLMDMDDEQLDFLAKKKN